MTECKKNAKTIKGCLEPNTFCELTLRTTFKRYEKYSFSQFENQLTDPLGLCVDIS